ncbi:hypothetical protein WJX74_008050 [Apatococcus lobatus]|uniref:Uncharacterized protein n=1 Tax=Apatococcus lobatus TaxID=904363 RepID=A0AAW1RX91_9CHLO
MTILPAWPHRPYGLSKLAPAHEQPLAQQLPRAASAQESSCGGQPVRFPEPLWGAEHAPPATCQPCFSSQGQTHTQPARALQDASPGATTKFVRGLEQAWRAPEDVSASKQVGSRLPSSEPQQLEYRSAEHAQQVASNLLFPVSLQHVRAEAFAAAQTTARTQGPCARAEGKQPSPPLLTRSDAQLPPELLTTAAKALLSPEPTCPVPIRPQPLSVLSPVKWHKHMAGQATFAEASALDWEPSEAEGHAEGSEPNNQRDQPRLIPRQGQGPRLRGKGGQHIDQYLMRLLRVGFKKAAEASLHHDEEDAHGCSKSRRKASTPASPRYPGESCTPGMVTSCETGGPSDEHPAAQRTAGAAPMLATTALLPSTKQSPGPQPSSGWWDHFHQPHAGWPCKPPGSQAATLDHLALAAHGFQQAQEQLHGSQSSSQPDEHRLVSLRGGPASCSRLCQALGESAFSSIRDLILWQQQQFTGQIMELHRVVHVQQQWASSPQAARCKSSPSSSAHPEAVWRPQQGPIGSAFANYPQDVSSTVQSGLRGAIPEPQQTSPDAACRVQLCHADRQLHTNQDQPGSKAIAPHDRQHADPAQHDLSPGQEQPGCVASGETPRLTGPANQTHPGHLSELTPAGWKQAGAQPAATHGLQQEWPAPSPPAGPLFASAMQELRQACASWPQLPPWPVQNPVRSASENCKMAGAQQPDRTQYGSRPCDPMAAWYQSHYGNWPGFMSPLPPGPAATGSFLTGTIPLGKPCSMQP